MKQQLVVTILGRYQPNIVERITRTIDDSGASILDCRLGVMCGEVAIMMQLGGSWSAIAKLEGMFPKLEQELDIRIISRRTVKGASAARRIPYTLEIVTNNREKVIHEVARFLLENGIDVCELYTSTFQSPHTEMTMLSIHMIINISTDSSIAAVRTEFMDFCDRHNLDGIMEPAK